MLPEKVIRERVTDAMMFNNVLDISYVKLNKEVTRRSIEPYEIKTENTNDKDGRLKKVSYLYGYDVTGGKNNQIKKWILTSFLNCKVNKFKTFKPRW